MFTVKDMNIEDVLNNLYKNENLTDLVKQDLDSLITLFYESFSNVSLENITQRIKTLSFENVNSFLSKKTMHYNEGTNAIQINVKSLETSENIKYHYMKTLLDMIVLNKRDQNHLLDAYNDGMKTIIASFLTGRDENEKVTPEESLVQIINNIIGSNDAFNIYFRSDPSLLVDALTREGMQMESIIPFLENMNYDKKMRDTLMKSSYQENIMKFAESFNDGLEERKVDKASDFIIENSDVFESDIDYGNLNDLSSIFKKYLKKEELSKTK